MISYNIISCFDTGKKPVQASPLLSYHDAYEHISKSNLQQYAVSKYSITSRSYISVIIMTPLLQERGALNTYILSRANGAGSPTNRPGSDKTRGQGSFGPSTGGPR